MIKLLPTSSISSTTMSPHNTSGVVLLCKPCGSSDSPHSYSLQNPSEMSPPLWSLPCRLFCVPLLTFYTLPLGPLSQWIEFVHIYFHTIANFVRMGIVCPPLYPWSLIQNLKNCGAWLMCVELRGGGRGWVSMEGFREAVMPQSPLRYRLSHAGLQTCFWKCPEVTTDCVWYDQDVT